MEFLRRAANPWGEEILLGASWDLFWLVAGLSLLFIVGHAVWAAAQVGDEGHEAMDPTRAGVVGDARVERHTAAARGFHWLMAASMLVLLVTAFVPILGLQFPWVTVHWIAGLVLAASILWHIAHATFWLDFWSIWPDRTDVRDAPRRVARMMGRDAPEPSLPGKYPLENKLFHLANVVAGLAVIVTGLFMMVRVQTPLWTRNPYLFDDATWGWVYVLHGLSAVAFVGLVAAHIYFAVRPEKWFITLSMIRGWMYGREYAAHHDPARWRLPDHEAPERVPATSDGSRATAAAGD